MDSRIITITENLMRDKFKLDYDYASETLNIKKNTVDLTMSNGLITLRAQFPRELIDDLVTSLAPAPLIEEEEDEDEEEVKAITKTRILRNNKR